jgi:hypothetical protein
MQRSSAGHLRANRPARHEALGNSKGKGSVLSKEGEGPGPVSGGQWIFTGNFPTARARAFLRIERDFLGFKIGSKIPLTTTDQEGWLFLAAAAPPLMVAGNYL